MTPTSPSAFMLSATLHGVLIALALLLNYASSREKEVPRIIELVAGEGTDIMAKEAPALGTESGVTIAIAKQPIPQPAPTPPPPPIQPAPVQPAPTPPPKTPPKAPAIDPEIDFKKQIKDDMRATNQKVKRELAKKHAEEEKRRKAEEKKQEDDAKKLTKEEFDKKYAGQKKVASATPSKSPNVKKIDVKGITGGVEGGASASKAGARGKALVSDNTDQMAAFYSFFKQELRRKFEPPPGLADSLEADVEFISNPDGSFARVRISKSSGVKEFDNAVLDAIRRVKMPARPDRKAQEVGFTFTMRDLSDG